MEVYNYRQPYPHIKAYEYEEMAYLAGRFLNSIGAGNNTISG